MIASTQGEGGSHGNTTRTGAFTAHATEDRADVAAAASATSAASAHIEAAMLDTAPGMVKADTSGKRLLVNHLRREAKEIA
jgi:hypothetical protein